MKPIKIIKFASMKEQKEGLSDWETLDETLIPFWHVIEEASSGDYTACGMAITEYIIKEKVGKVTCPNCLRIIKFYKDLGK